MNKDINFECMEEFADYVVEKVECDEDLFVSVLGKFEEIKNIIKELFCIAEVDFEMLNIESPDVDGYCDEYVLDCWCEDGIVQIGCEPAKRDGEYINFMGDETYLLDNVSDEIISFCEGTDFYCVNIDDECDYDDGECCKCCECDCCGGDSCIEDSKCGDDDVYGFTVNNETDNGYSKFTFYSSKPVGKIDIRDILKKYWF